MTTFSRSTAWSQQAPYQTALDALRLGWSVFPLDAEKMPPQTGGMHSNGTPKRLGWKAYQTRLPTLQELAGWQKRYQPLAWAIITGGLSKIIILDFDDEAGKKTRERLGLLHPHVQTGSGGHHVYFHHPGWQVPTLNSKSKKELGARWPGLDIRADGGYAAFCGRNSSGPYRWLREPVLEDLDLLPDDLRTFLGLLHAPAQPVRDPHEQREKRTDLADRLIAKYVGEARARGRNNAGFDLACQLRDNGYSQHEAEGVLRQYARMVPDTNTKGQTERYTEAEALLSVESAYHKGPREAWTVSTEAPSSTVTESTIRQNGTRRKYAALLTLPSVDLTYVLKCLSNTEWGDSNLFAHLFKGRVVYDHLEKRWYFYQGHAWQKDSMQFVKQLVADVLASAYLRASVEQNTKLEAVPTSSARDLLHEESPEEEAEQRRNDHLKRQVKALYARAIELRTSARNSSVLSLALSHVDLAVTSEVWDTDPWLLGTKTGVLDLRTGTLRPGTPDDYIRTVIPTPWKGVEERAPRFEQYLQEIFADRGEEERAELIGFLQRALGYGLTGNVNEHIFLMLYGEEGRNGKDTLMSVLARVLGETVGAVSNDVIIASGKQATPGSAKPHLCSLQGKRIAWASETDKGARFDIAQVKFLTGGGSIPARHLYGEDFTFEPSHLLVLLTNNKPHADASDKAFWERLCPITFNLRFVDRPEAPNERKKDTRLGQALQAEASGILAWLVRGCLDWQRKGLQIPACILRERKAYQGEEDTLGQFLDEYCVITPQAKVQANLLYDRYAQWCEENRLKAMTGTAFGLAMGKRYRRDREKNGKYYYGIGLRATDELIVYSSVGLPQNYTPPHETASSADVGPLSSSSRVYSFKNYTPPREAASEADTEPLENDAGVGYVQFSSKKFLKPEKNSPVEKVFSKTIHTLHQKPNNTDNEDAITPPEKPPEWAGTETTQTIHQKPSNNQDENGQKRAPEATSQDNVGFEGNSAPLYTRQPCTTRYEKRKQVAHQAVATQFVAGYWWCEQCEPQRTLMALGEYTNYPPIHARGFHVQPGREEWLRFAQEAGYTLVVAALEAMQPSREVQEL